MLRAIVKNATAGAVSWTRLASLARARSHGRLPFVAYYHRVVDRLNASDGFALPAMEISVAMLERHLDWLGRHFQIVSLEDLDAEIGTFHSRPLAAVTFDDGYRDTYHHAFPLLKRKGIPAAVFIITDLVGSSKLPIHDELHALLMGASRQWKSLADGLNDILQKSKLKASVPERSLKGAQDPFSATRLLLNHLSQADIQRIVDTLEETTEVDEAVRRELQPLDWEMLAEMRDAGITIGSHSKTHPFLANEREELVREEVEGSRTELKRRLGVETDYFAYPGGSFDQAAIQAVAAAGYRYAFTICQHRDPQYPLLTIPRTGMWEKSCLDPFGRFSPSIMSCETAGTFNFISRCTQPHAAERS
jgi:peptidoglycan/xylan/chitin deacetylase (PgdA/CDA1 family)